MVIEYLGTRKVRTVNFPIPFVSLSEKCGTMVWNGQGDMQDVPEGCEQHAKTLLEMAPEQFKVVEKKPATGATANTPQRPSAKR